MSVEVYRFYCPNFNSRNETCHLLYGSSQIYKHSFVGFTEIIIVGTIMCDLAPNECCLQFVITCHLGGVGSLNMDWLTAALSLFVMYMNISVMISTRSIYILIRRNNSAASCSISVRISNLPDGMHVAFVFAENKKLNVVFTGKWPTNASSRRKHHWFL